MRSVAPELQARWLTVKSREKAEGIMQADRKLLFSLGGAAKRVDELSSGFVLYANNLS